MVIVRVEYSLQPMMDSREDCTHFCDLYTFVTSILLRPLEGTYRIAGNFCDFRDQRPKRENKNHEIRNHENLNVNFRKFLPRVFSALVLVDHTSDDGTTALFQTDR